MDKPVNTMNKVQSNVKSSNQHLNVINGWLEGVEHQPSPHFTERVPEQDISLLVVHNISLPPGEYGGSYITDLFLGRLAPNAHPYFEEIYQLQVSAHCLIKREGSIIQYVSFNNKAWHAGVSHYKGRDKCNDFSIGIELEGTDTDAYTEQQYQQLAGIVNALQKHYPLINSRDIVGHCDIAPGRKTDPGQAFNWSYFQTLIQK